MEEAIKSWYETVYLPVATAIVKSRIMRYFRKNTISDLYVFIIKFYDDLKKKFGDDINLDEIVDDLKHKRKLSILRRITNTFKKIILKNNLNNFMF